MSGRPDLERFVGEWTMRHPVYQLAQYALSLEKQLSPRKGLIPVKYFVGDKMDSQRHHAWIHIEARVQRDDSVLWAVTRLGDVLSKSDRDFVWEPQPSSRTDEHLADTRFASPDEALAFLKSCKTVFGGEPE